MVSQSPVIHAHGLGKQYRIYHRPVDRLIQMLVGSRKQCYQAFDALKDINIAIHKGESVGIIGANGSGKSTLLQLICGTITPTSGEVSTKGRISALLELGAGFNPEFSGKENITLNASILGLSKQEIERLYPSIVAFSGLEEELLEQPVKTYSSGMYVRLAFSVAVAVEPNILVVDEALAVGDEAFQRKCFMRLEELKSKGCTILFVSHSAEAVVELCDRAILLDHGELIYEGEPKQVVSQYRKLIYAADDRYQATREAIKQHALDDDEAKESDDFIENMESESRVEYESRGAYIDNPHLKNTKGETVNILHPGQTYTYHYAVTFEEAARDAVCGILIKTERGVEVAGVKSDLKEPPVAEVKPGMQLDVAFEFTCNLMPGTYFLNCGCHAIKNGEACFMHRITDAVMFKVSKEPDSHSKVGLVDMTIMPSILTKT
jgi:lipopolysaccharide transport system ATP-binding protein